MMITALCLVTTVMVLNIHHHRDDKPVPPMMRTVILDRMAHLLCIRRQSHKSIHPVTEQWPMIDVQELDEKKGVPGYINDVKLPPDIVQFVRKKILDDKDKDVCSSNKADWECVARVIDRFLLILFLVGVVLMSVTYLVLIING